MRDGSEEGSFARSGHELDAAVDRRNLPPPALGAPEVSLILFVQDRIARGRMEPVSLSRANAMVRRFDNEGRLMVCAPGALAPTIPSCGRLEVREVRLRDASAFVNMYHRHLAAPIGHLFSLAALVDGVVVGAAIVGRPVARHLDDGRTVEITRLASNGMRNVPSKLLGAVRREAAKRGFQLVVTYTLAAEPGTSLRAAGYVSQGAAGGGSWSRRQRLRTDRHPTEAKQRWSTMTGHNASQPAGPCSRKPR